ncbi:MAG: Na/Pi cotransporter family protein [Planctomycetota bacterium]
MPVLPLAAVVVDALIGLVGGLALFLYGMRRVTSAFEALASRGMSKQLGRLTKNRFTSMVTGAVTTMVVQSSSITTVVVVGLVSAGVLTLVQSVGIILGANIGTTVTAQVIAFPVAKYAVLFVAIGFGMQVAARKDLVERAGHAVLGLGLVFLGMDLMGQAMQPLRSAPWLQQALQTAHNPVLGVLMGAAFTALVLSSSATTGIVIILAGQGLIDLRAGGALVLGANIGTCVTAWLATLGRPVVARQVAWVHAMFNLLGVIVWLPLLGVLTSEAKALAPHDVPRQVAHVHTLFNLSTTILLLPFASWVARAAERLAPTPKVAHADETEKASHLDRLYLSAPHTALQQVRREIVRLSTLVRPMLTGAMRVIGEGSTRVAQAWAAQAATPRRVHEAILAYLADLSRRDLSSKDAEALASLMQAADHVESIVDTLLVSMGLVGQERREQGLELNPETLMAFEEIAKDIVHQLDEAAACLETLDVARAEAIVASKDQTYSLTDALSRRLGRRLIADAPQRLATYRLESDLLDHWKRISWSVRRVGRIVAEHGPALGP